MKSGGPWNLRGLRAEAREAARTAARRSGMSVGEWLNNVIEPGDDDYGEPVTFSEDDDYGGGWRGDSSRGDRNSRPRRRERRDRHSDYDSDRRRERDAYRSRDRNADRSHEREELGEVHARLDRLTDQLERMLSSTAPRMTGAPRRPRNAPRQDHQPTNSPVTVDDAVAQIAERQRALYAETPNVSFAPPSGRGAPGSSEPAIDIGSLEDQLRYITTRLESLRPTSDLERAIRAVRRDLSDIQRQLTEALPRHAVESLEIEVQALARRIDHTRAANGDTDVLSGLENGLAEVRDALRGLKPAESLVGFDEAVKALGQKVDQIIAREDPAALQQLEAAIGALRGIVSHVASNDSLAKVAEDVRALAAKVDGLANHAASGQALTALEGRINVLANALDASTEAGHAVPRELEKMLAGLIEKLEWVQLTHTDHAALAHLEDRIAQLIKRLDSSDARLNNLAAVERGLADLLVHIDKAGGGTPAAGPGMAKPVAVDAIQRDVAEIKRGDRRTQDSLEAVHGVVEHVVDRLAMIETDMHGGRAGAEPTRQSPSVQPAADDAAPSLQPASAPVPIEAAPPRRTSASRPPIDPHLPPDHPLEPGSATGTRGMPSAAERIAASEAAAAGFKPPVLDDRADRPDFIAAARRAAQTAAASPSYRPSAAGDEARAAKTSPLRKIIVAAAALIVAIGCVHVAMHTFRGTDDNSAAVAPQESPTPSDMLPDNGPVPPRPAGPLVLPVPGASAEPPAKPVTPPPSPPASNPQQVSPARRSALDDPNDITGAVAGRAPPPAMTALPPLTSAPLASAPPAASADAAAAPVQLDKLPAAIGGPALRAAAIAGDAAAAFEVATRFAEGHDVPPSNELAARWLERAAKQGLALAQFRLGGFYEKGIGVKKDLAAARDLYLAAAQQGNGKAMHNLAVLYAEGINGPADYRTAAQWFRKAADRGITDSQYNLAILYARGIGVEQNYAESYKWFVLAASQGDSEAAKKRDEVVAHLDAPSLAAAQSAVQKWSPEPQPEDATSVKAPPGGWDQIAQTKTKPKPAVAKPAAP
jgi:localization factor PodJL